MVNILRMDLYRLIHGKSLWVFLAIIIGMAIITTGMLHYTTSPEFLEALENGSATVGVTVGISDPTAITDDYTSATTAMQALVTGTTQMAFVGSIFINGGALATMFIIFISIFLASEFESGFSKNVFTAQSNRFVFLGACVIEIILLAAVFSAVSIAATLAAAAVAGFTFQAAPLADLFLWFGLITLILAAFGTVTGLFVWLTRKMVVGIVAGCCFATGLVTTIVQGVLLLFPKFADLVNYTMYTCMASLGKGLNLDGGLSAVHIAGVGIVFIVVAAAHTAVALKKKDI